jgi:redox-sensitive bicupin YhaK (pirin superfamily)
VQLWVNLPKKFKSEAPHYQALSAEGMGRVELPGNKGVVNVIAGTFNDVKGPAQTYSPVNLVDIKLDKDGEVTFPVPASHNTALLVIEGNVVVNEQAAPGHSFVLFKNEGEDISIRALENSVVLLLSGEPINEPIASYGPFVMNTQEEIFEAIQDYQRGKFGTL